MTQSGVSAVQGGVGLAEATCEHGHRTDPAYAHHGHAEPGRRQGLKVVGSSRVREQEGLRRQGEGGQPGRTVG